MEMLRTFKPDPYKVTYREEIMSLPPNEEM